MCLISVLHHLIVIFSTVCTSVYLSGGGMSGNLEYLDDFGTRGAVCADGFDDNAADVVCRQLGYVRSNGTYTYTTRYIPD